MSLLLLVVAVVSESPIVDGGVCSGKFTKVLLISESRLPSTQRCCLYSGAHLQQATWWVIAVVTRNAVPDLTGCGPITFYFKERNTVQSFIQGLLTGRMPVLQLAQTRYINLPLFVCFSTLVTSYCVKTRFPTVGYQ